MDLQAHNWFYWQSVKFQNFDSTQTTPSNGIPGTHPDFFMMVHPKMNDLCYQFGEICYFNIIYNSNIYCSKNKVVFKRWSLISMTGLNH